MALVASRKIKRFLRICQVYRLYSNTVTNPNYLAEITNKSAEKIQKNNQIKNVETAINSQKDAKQDKPVFEKYPVFTSELEQNEVQQLRRRFAKSSTQIALTQPLKLPRLANPFPDPVKTLASDTIADDEKARLMHEEVKMEARYHLQMQQEKLLQEKINKMAQEQHLNLKDNEYDQQEQSCQQFQSMPINNVKKKQPTYRKPKDYNELQKEQSESHNPSQRNFAVNQNQFNYQNSEFQNQNHINPVNDKHAFHVENNIKASTLNNPPKNDQKKKKKQRKRCRSRNMKNTTVSRRRPHTNPYSTYLNRRFFSSKSNSINPAIINETEQAEIILERLKTLYPEYKNLKKPVCVSGDEEKQFINYILKLLGKHKIEAQKVTKNCAPFPSYSEMKTYVHEAQSFKQENINYSNSDTNLQYYHTKNNNVNFMDPMPKKVKKYKHISYNPSPKSKKEEAPYPAFSEFQDNYDGDMSSWRSDTCGTVNKKFYSTMSKDDAEKQAKKKPPCKNPFPPLPECDYEETARKNAERKKRKGRCPGKGKKCSPEDDHTIINKIKMWLNTCKPDAENIKVTRSAVDVDGRETYVIELNEIKEVNADECLALEQKDKKVEVVEEKEKTFTNKTETVPNRNIDYKPNECKQSHVTELTDNIPVVSKNIPDFNSSHEPDSVIIRRPEDLTMNKKKNDKLPESKSLISINSKAGEIRSNDNMEKIKQILERKFYETAKINKVKGHLQVKPKVKKIEEINKDDVGVKYKLFKNHKLTKNKTKKTSKPRRTTYTSEDLNYINQRIDNKYKEIKRDANYLPEPCPNITNAVLSFSSKKKDKCKKEKPPEVCPKKKKCRYKKKRKLPSCDDVPGNKTCMPFYISELERNYMLPKEYMSYNNKANDDKNSKQTDLKGGEVAVLANQNSLQEAANNEPFKLKPQFWRK